MRAFVGVAESGSFSRTATRLGLSKSIVSRRIGRLESELGAKLLARTTRGVSVTDTGQDFARRAVRILAELDEARATVADREGQVVGTLRIAAPLSFGVLHLASALAGFAARYPRLTIDVAYADRFVDLVSDGIDVAVRIGALKDSNLLARRLSPIRNVVVASPGYLERHGVPAAPEDLLRHECLIYSGGVTGEQWRFRVGRRWQTVKAQGRFRSDNGDALREAAVAGLGIARLPTFIASSALDSGAVRVVLPDFPLAELGLYAVWPGGAPARGGRVRAFVDFLAERFGPEPYWDPCWSKVPDGPSTRGKGQDQAAPPPSGVSS